MGMGEPFITGSRCYGEPTEESDLDLVVHMPAEVADKIWEELFPGQPRGSDEYSTTTTNHFSVFRFGQLNLIATHTNAAYDAWKVGTDKCVAQLLKKRKALTRTEAVTIIRKELDRRGIDD